MKPIWSWLFPLLVVSLAVYVAYRNHPWTWNDAGDKWFALVMGAVVTIFLSAVASAVGYGLSRIIGDSSDCIWHQYWSATIVSMREADGLQGKISGGLFMLVGQIGSKQVYHYYTQNSDGSLRPQSWTADSDTSLFEEDRKDGKVVQFDMAFRRPWVDWIGIPDDRLRMDFHIPAGTLKRSFEIE